MLFTGMPCTPWTNIGPRLQEAHSAIEIVNICLAAHGESRLEIIGIEEAPGFPVERFKQSLPEGYFIVGFVYGSQDF
jgi:hypothetical protein